MLDPKSAPAVPAIVPKNAPPTLKEVLASAPTVHEVLARPFVYEAWLKKAKEALARSYVEALNG